MIIKEEIQLARLEKLKAETRHINAVADASAFDAETSRILAQTADLSWVKDQERYNWEKAGPGENRVIHFTEGVKHDTVATVIDMMSRWDEMDTKDEDDQANADLTDPIRLPYTLEICSGGGEVVAGFKLYAFLRNLAKKRELVTVATGLCGSMATVLHQAGTVRLIDEGCSYLIHNPSSGAFGTIEAMEDRVGWVNQLKTTMHGILSERSTLTLDEMAERAERKDWWLIANDVVELGLADGVR